MYAIIELSGKQFRIEPKKELKVPKQPGDIGDKITVDRVLYFDNGKEKLIGTPLIKDIVFNGKIVSHGRDKKIIVYKMKRRKRYRRKHGHRQDFTLVAFDDLAITKKKLSSTKKATKTKTTTKKTTEAASSSVKTKQKSTSTKKVAEAKTATKKTDKTSVKSKPTSKKKD